MKQYFLYANCENSIWCFIWLSHLILSHGYYSYCILWIYLTSYLWGRCHFFIFKSSRTPTQTLFLVSAVLKSIYWWRNEWLFTRQTSSKFKWIAQDQPCTYWLDWVQTHICVSSNPAHILQYSGNLRHLLLIDSWVRKGGCKGNKLDWHGNSV